MIFLFRNFLISDQGNEITLQKIFPKDFLNNNLIFDFSDFFLTPQKKCICRLAMDTNKKPGLCRAVSIDITRFAAKIRYVNLILTFLFSSIRLLCF